MNRIILLDVGMEKIRNTPWDTGAESARGNEVLQGNRIIRHPSKSGNDGIKPDTAEAFLEFGRRRAAPCIGWRHPHDHPIADDAHGRAGGALHETMLRGAERDNQQTPVEGPMILVMLNTTEFNATAFMRAGFGTNTGTAL